MKKTNVFAVLTIIIFALFMISCGEGTETDDEQANDEAATDEVVTDEAADETVDETPDEDIVVILKYPEVTATSNKRGDIAQNLEFYDETDKKRTLAEWYRENDKDSKLIWLVFSTYDCTYCNIEKKDLPKINNQDYVDRGFRMVLIMNGLLSGPQITLEPAKIAKLKEYNLTAYGDVANYTAYGFLKSQTLFNKFINTGYPVNIFIDTKKMEIVDHFEGWDTSLTEKYDKFIDFMLDEL